MRGYEVLLAVSVVGMVAAMAVDKATRPEPQPNGVVKSVCVSPDPEDCKHCERVTTQEPDGGRHSDWICWHEEGRK